MLREEIVEILNLFDSCKIDEDKQKSVFTNGVNFNFTYGDPDYNKRNRYMDVFAFSNFLRKCKAMNLQLDFNQVIERPHNYEKLLKFVESMDEIIPNNHKVYVKKQGKKGD